MKISENIYSLDLENEVQAGDALTAENGKIAPPVSHFTANMDRAAEAIKKFSRYNLDKVFCYHGGLAKISNNELNELYESVKRQ